jgi:elongator complex protein 3
MKRRGTRCQCVRCREIRKQKVAEGQLTLDEVVYRAGGAEERFLSYVTPDDQLAGFLRLSLPGPGSPQTGLADLAGAAIIREVHVYGLSLELGAEQRGIAQHSGMGTELIELAGQIARRQGYPRLAVIAAVGTRRYYASRGFKRGELYYLKTLA